MGSSSSFWNVAYRQAMKSGVFVAKVYSFLHVTTTYLAFPAFAFGPSMIPTLHPSGNVVLAERISTRSRKLSRGDVIVLQSPEDPNKIPIKRVIGLEGDCVSFVVDPEKNDESRTVVVPKGHVWVQGDYTQNSRDSRIFGPLPYGLIRGRVLWRVCICLTLYSLISRIKSVFFFCILFGNQYGLVSNDI
ncbi:PREDICTED: mitochondrial inner membrane protease subunit 1 isoform X1 [Brassica oleracea var. oleracea]|uniref:mitochondrial inner membrane protease subunit 1 isoform X1 n=1 Tax=Brassica oleracea var. oleracea TaxID=109376 RepID=UPI0006A6C616|nr:PREDICTED: mitochondrial inner membrane protease subunit 1 isoform X1 [Brassica oleracea var. oleracea]